MSLLIFLLPTMYHGSSLFCNILALISLQTRATASERPEREGQTTHSEQFKQR